MTDQNIKYSFSSLDKYEKCNGRWYRYKGLGQEEPPTEISEFGRAAHKAIKYILADNLPKEQAIEKAISEASLPFDPQELDKVIGQHVMGFAGKVKPEQVERYFELKLSDEDDAPVICGYIDLDLDNGIIDWKSGWKVKGPQETYQLGIYAWAKSRETGIEEIAGQLFYLRFPRDLNHCHLYKKEDMEKARKWAYDLAREIEGKMLSLAFEEDTADSLFPDTPGNHCRGCGYACECYQKYEQSQQSEEQQPEHTLPEPETNGTPETPEPPVENEKPEETKPEQPEQKPQESESKTPQVPKNKDEADKLAREILRLEEVISNYKECLKAWVVEHGSVQVGDQEFGIKESVSYQFEPDNLKQFAQYLVNKSINPWEILTLGATQVNKLAKKGVTVDEILKYAKTKSNKSFRRYKAEKTEEGVA